MPRIGDLVGKSLSIVDDGNRAAEVDTHTADGAITLKNGTVLLGSGSALAMTLKVPLAADDGKVLIITAITAQAHVVTGSTGFNASANTIATFGGAIGDTLMVVAANGKWNEIVSKNVTLSAPL